MRVFCPTPPPPFPDRYNPTNRMCREYITLTKGPISLLEVEFKLVD